MPRPAAHSDVHEPDWIRWILQRRFFLLLVAMLGFMLAQPLLQDISQRGVFGILSTLVLVTALYSVRSNRRTLVVGLVLGLPYFGALWTNFFTPDSMQLDLSQYASALAFHLFITLILVGEVLRTPRITQDTLHGAACVYLLMGLTWSMAYMILNELDPGAFRFPDDPSASLDRNMELVYYSYVTLTTLGYGEVTPVAPLARSLAIVEAISGVLYLAFLVARLVAMHMIDSRRRSD